MALSILGHPFRYQTRIPYIFTLDQNPKIPSSPLLPSPALLPLFPLSPLFNLFPQSNNPPSNLLHQLPILTTQRPNLIKDLLLSLSLLVGEIEAHVCADCRRQQGDGEGFVVFGEEDLVFLEKWMLGF